MRLHRLAAPTFLLFAGPVLAQNGGISLPDALGARVPEPGTGRATDYDALIGTWRFRFQSSARPEPGRPTSYYPVAPGTWTFRRTHDGLMVADDFRLDSGDATATFRVFDPEKRRWEIQGTDVGSGRWDDGITWSDGEDRLVIQRMDATGQRVMRARYRFLSPDRFVWRADVTWDGGKTWVKDGMRLEAERAAGAAGEPSEASLLAARDAVWHDWFAAAPGLAATLPADFIGIQGGDSAWADRETTLAESRASAASGVRLVTLEFPRNRIERYGPVAIVHSRYRAVLEGPKGRNTLAGQITEVFRWDGRRWLHPSWHMEVDR
jgi:hypothetical protein